MIIYGIFRNQLATLYFSVSNKTLIVLLSVLCYNKQRYNAMALDIPNATQTTFVILMWLFPQNFTKAQKFYFYEIVDL